MKLRIEKSSISDGVTIEFPNRAKLDYYDKLKDMCFYASTFTKNGESYLLEEFKILIDDNTISFEDRILTLESLIFNLFCPNFHLTDEDLDNAPYVFYDSEDLYYNQLMESYKGVKITISTEEEGKIFRDKLKVIIDDNALTFWKKVNLLDSMIKSSGMNLFGYSLDTDSK